MTSTRSGVAVGSVNCGSSQRGAIYSGGSGTVIYPDDAGGSFFVTAFGINDSGRVVGQGIDPNNAARNVGIVYDIGGANAFEVGALPDANGALAFAVSNTGFVTGSSMMNQGSGLPLSGRMQAASSPFRCPPARARAPAERELRGLGGRHCFIRFCDPVPLRRKRHLSPPGSHPGGQRLGFIHEHLLVGHGHQRQRRHRRYWRV